MSYRPATVTQAEWTRAIKAAVAAGVVVGRIELDPRTGRVVVYAAGSSAEAAQNPWDDP